MLEEGHKRECPNRTQHPLLSELPHWMVRRDTPPTHVGRQQEGGREAEQDMHRLQPVAVINPLLRRHCVPRAPGCNPQDLPP